MPVIAVVSQKGGTGKTTISTNLACAFAELFQVLLLDADGQSSALDWADSRAQRLLGVEVRRVEPSRLLQDVRLLAPSFPLVIIDGPPGITRTNAEAVRAANLVLVPVKPGPFDVWAVSDIVDAVKARQETASGLPKAAFVVTMCKTRSRLSQQIEAALDEYGLPVLQARTTDRVAYPQAIIEGKSVLEGRDRTARQEILALRDEIERLIDDP